jgi:hypothetical protein
MVSIWHGYALDPLACYLGAASGVLGWFERFVAGGQWPAECAAGDVAMRVAGPAILIMDEMGTPGGGTRYSTVTLLARLRGLSTSQPRSTAMW